MGARRHLGLHSKVVFWAHPIHAAWLARGLDHACGDHRCCTLGARLSGLISVLVLAEAGPRSLAKFRTRCHEVRSSHQNTAPSIDHDALIAAPRINGARNVMPLTSEGRSDGAVEGGFQQHR